MAGPQYKVAHILPWTAVGGTEQATLSLARALGGGQFEHTMFCRGDSPFVTDFFAAAGFETVGYEPVELTLRRPRRSAGAAVRLAREFERRGVGLVHCSDLPGGRYAAAAAKLARLPLICHVRCRAEHILLPDRAWLFSVDKFVFVSEDVRHSFGSGRSRRQGVFRYHLPARRGVVIYDNGPETGDAGVVGEAKQDVRRELNIPDGAKVIGMVGRVAPQKDYHTLAGAAARIVAAGADVRFLIVGSYSMAEEQRKHFAEVQQMLAANNVAPYFIFTDHRADVLRLMSAMDVCVLSTHTEGFGLVLVEAMSLGRPVVATAVGGVPEIVRDGETGLLHRHGDAAHLAEQILSLLRDERRAAALGEAGRRSVKTRFGRRQFAAKMTNLYHEVLGTDGGGSADELAEGRQAV